jgi:hypothetical protein
MKKQTLIIEFNNPHKSLAPTIELVSDIKKQLGIGNVKFKLTSNVSLDLSEVSITIESKMKCDDIMNMVRPVLEQTNIETEATVTLNYGEKFIEVPFSMGEDCKKVDQQFIKNTADLLSRNIPSKHGFVLISYAKNGSNTEIFTENGKPKQKELMEVYQLFASSLK